ncbi:hypothetical protein [Tenacibaculum maritimum]|uniref:hypothetical protein n=2 Tax=Tenacibaculum maritimum TaxID=107401 RepID=UPI0021CF53D2|nr:hypothetical protein [Tenacibaculum maritimum]
MVFVTYVFKDRYMMMISNSVAYRFRWYDDVDGRYISKDPIGLLSGEYGFYNYVGDSNGWMDVFGLDTIKLRHYTSNKGLAIMKKNTVIKAFENDPVPLFPKN